LDRPCIFAQIIALSGRLGNNRNARRNKTGYDERRGVNETPTKLRPDGEGVVDDPPRFARRNS